MLPAVLICTHQRKKITSANLKTLLAQSLVPIIILVVSTEEEREYYTFNFPQVKVIMQPNEPLGAKWQAGAEYARNLNCSMLIILGSDDILSRGFVKNCTDLLMQGNDFMGLQRWWIWSPELDTLFLFDYMPVNFPLGGGRYYSRKLLEKLNYKIFDPTLNSRLDDKGWNLSKDGKTLLVRDTETARLNILAVKGDWHVMNPLKATLTHPNAKQLAVYQGKNARIIMKQKFNYSE